MRAGQRIGEGTRDVLRAVLGGDVRGARLADRGWDLHHAVGAGQGRIHPGQQCVGTGRDAIAARNRDGRARRNDIGRAAGATAPAEAAGEIRVIGRDLGLVARDQRIDLPTVRILRRRAIPHIGGEHVARAVSARQFGSVDVAAATQVEDSVGIGRDVSARNGD